MSLRRGPSKNDAEAKGGWLECICTNPDGSQCTVAGIHLSDWGIILGCLALLYTFLGFFYAGLINIAIEVRQEDWLLLADNHYGPFERASRYLLNPRTHEKIPALSPPEDTSLVTREMTYREYNRPDGCVKQTVEGTSVEVLICDASGEASDRRWVVNPWLIDLARTASSPYFSEACGYSNTGASILLANGLPYGSGTCVNGIGNSIR